LMISNQMISLVAMQVHHRIQVINNIGHNEIGNSKAMVKINL